MRLDRCLLARGDPAEGTCLLCGFPLPARARRFCSTACSEVWSINHYWHLARDRALRISGYRCAVCGDPEDLEVHHRDPVGGNRAAGCRHHLDRLVVLCHDHHAEHTRAERARPGTVTQLSLLAS